MHNSSHDHSTINKLSLDLTLIYRGTLVYYGSSVRVGHFMNYSFFWYSNNSVNYSSGRIEYRIPSRQSFLCRIVTDKCQIVTDEPNGNFFHFQYETVYCQAVAHCTALVSSLESRSSVKVDWGVQVPRLLLCRSNFCHYLIYLLQYEYRYSSISTICGDE